MMPLNIVRQIADADTAVLLRRFSHRSHPLLLSLGSFLEASTHEPRVVKKDFLYDKDRHSLTQLRSSFHEAEDYCKNGQSSTGLCSFESPRRAGPPVLSLWHPNTVRSVHVFGKLEAVEVGNGDSCLEVANFSEVVRVRRKLSAVLIGGMERDHHV